MCYTQTSNQLKLNILINCNHIHCNNIFFLISNVHMHGNSGINNVDDSDGDDDDLFVNPNHQKTTCYVDSDSSEESEDNEE